jgi:uncharacterized protein (TIGR02996 family)
MTTEDDFQTALAAEPRDWHLRLVFADWLDERGDARAAGYRAMGLRRVAPTLWVAGGGPWVWLNAHYYGSYKHRAEELRVSVLPDDWYNLLPPPRTPDRCAEERRVLREALDDAARAFAQLPPARRAELLT